MKDAHHPTYSPGVRVTRNTPAAGWQDKGIVDRVALDEHHDGNEYLVLRVRWDAGFRSYVYPCAVSPASTPASAAAEDGSLVPADYYRS